MKAYERMELIDAHVLNSYSGHCNARKNVLVPITLEAAWTSDFVWTLQTREKYLTSYPLLNICPDLANFFLSLLRVFRNACLSLETCRVYFPVALSTLVFIMRKHKDSGLQAQLTIEFHSSCV
jgi:hypothetical protein